MSYVVLGSITTAANTVSSARKDMTLQQEERLGTSILMADVHYHVVGSIIDFGIQNTGNQIINNVSQAEVILTISPNAPILYKNGDGTGATWYNNGLWLDTTGTQGEIVNPGQLDPGEYLWGEIWLGSKPDQLEVILPNGGKASSANIPSI